MSYKVSYLVPKYEFEQLTQGEWRSSKHKERKETENKKQKVSNDRKKKPKKVVRLREKLRKMIKVSRSTTPRKKPPKLGNVLPKKRCMLELRRES